MQRTKQTPMGTQTEREALTELYLSAVEQGLTATVTYIANEFKHHGWPLPSAQTDVSMPKFAQDTLAFLIETIAHLAPSATIQAHARHLLIAAHIVRHASNDQLLAAVKAVDNAN